MQRRAPTLRRRLTIAIVTVAVLAVVAAASLVGLTDVLHRASVRSTSAVESVRLAEEVQRDILLHDRIRNPVLRAQIRSGLHERLGHARDRVSSREQGAALGTADRAVMDYLAADDAPVRDAADVADKHTAAFAALETLVAMNIDDARRAYENVERYDSLADAIGISVAAAVIAASAAVLWWLHTRALRPLFGLARAMKRFGHGDVDERAREEGPEELAEMARRFNEMATAIARQSRERQTFIAGVAHDLRNPLAVLRMSADLVKPSGSPLAPEKAARVFEAVRRQVERLDRMIGDLLDSASVQAGNVPLRIASHDVRSIALEVVQHYEQTSTEHDFVLDLPESAVLLDCDGMRVEQILSNLVSNAIKYSPNGGLVAVSLRVTTEAAVFTVRDAGIGMTEEDAAKAFEPFRRSAALRDQVAGSGLGLFVVRRLVEAHGGRVHVETEPGAGSTFVVELPVRPKLLGAEPAASTTASSSSSSTSASPATPAPRSSGVAHIS